MQVAQTLGRNGFCAVEMDDKDISTANGSDAFVRGDLLGGSAE